MKHSDQGIVKDEKGQEQPKDKERAQAAPRTGCKDSVSREATRDSKPDVSKASKAQKGR
jgi:hypothetical protein